MKDIKKDKDKIKKVKVIVTPVYVGKRPINEVFENVISEKISKTINVS